MTIPLTHGPPQTKAAAPSRIGDGGNFVSAGTDDNTSHIGVSASHILVAAAVVHLRRAGFHAYTAQVLLDDAGFESADLNVIGADISGLLATWAGRRRPPEIEPVPHHIAEAAAVWRRSQRRTY